MPAANNQRLFVEYDLLLSNRVWRVNLEPLAQRRPHAKSALSNILLARIELSAIVENIENRAEIWTSIHSFSIKPSQADVAFMAKKASGSRFGVDIALFQPNEGNSVDA